MCFLLMNFVPVQKLCVNKYIYIYALLYEFCFLWFTNCILLSDDNSLIPGCVWLFAFVLNNTLIVGIWCSTIPNLPGCFCPWTFFEYRIQHGSIGPLYVTSSYSTWIFCRGVSGFATDCPCNVWCRGLTTCLLHVGPPFGNRFLNISLRFSLKFVPKVRINNIPSLVQIMAWCRPGNKPLYEPMMVSLLTHICVTRPQWVNK